MLSNLFLYVMYPKLKYARVFPFYSFLTLLNFFNENKRSLVEGAVRLGATTLSIKTFRLTTLSIMTLSITTLRITTFSIIFK
jgi:hypothetical protein